MSCWSLNLKGSGRNYWWIRNRFHGCIEKTWWRRQDWWWCWEQKKKPNGLKLSMHPNSSMVAPENVLKENVNTSTTAKYKSLSWKSRKTRWRSYISKSGWCWNTYFAWIRGKKWWRRCYISESWWCWKTHLAWIRKSVSWPKSMFIRNSYSYFTKNKD